MATIKERIVAWMGVTIAVISAVTLTAVVIIQQVLSNQTNSTPPPPPSASPTASKGKTLQGTQLQNFTPTAVVDQLSINDLVPGTGQAVKSSDSVTVDYTGAVAASGTIFQSSVDSGNSVTFSLNQVIKGWQDGLVGMKVGGVRRLLIPASEAYGATPPQGSGIPANAALVFDITLHSIGS